MTDPTADHPPLAGPIVLGERRGFDGAHLHLRVDRVRLPSGRETTREVLEHPGAVAVLPITEDGRVLLLRQYHHPIGEALLGIPAGTAEPGEDPIETARRELVEETGFEAARLVEQTSFFTSPGYTTERMTLFRADGCRPTGGHPAADELIQLVPTALDEIPALLQPGPDQIREAKTLIALLWLLANER